MNVQTPLLKNHLAAHESKSKTAWLLRLSSVFLMALVALPLHAATGLSFLETKDLRVVYYSPGGTFLVPPTVQNLAASLESNRKIFGYSPKDKINVLLQDFSDVSSGAVMPVPRNRIFIDTAPQSDPYEYTSAGELLAWLSAHEISSLMSTDKPGPKEERYRRFFQGKVGVDSSHPESVFYRYLTNPRLSSPGWFREGTAVFSETWLMGGLGRAQGGYDEMVFRAMVRDDAHFYDPLGLVANGTEVTFQTGAAAYLYGTRFMNYLALTYGPNRLVAWWSVDKDSHSDYAADFQRVFGLPLKRAWQDWVDWEKNFQQKNLEKVRENPLTPFKDLTAEPLGTISRGFLSEDGATLYAATQRPGQLASLVGIQLQNGKVAPLHEVVGPSSIKVTSLAYDPANATLFYTTDNNHFRNLEAFELRTGTTKTLLKQARIGDIAFNSADRSLWGIRFNNGLAMLVRIPYPYSAYEVAHLFEYGERPFDLDVSPDGSMLAYSLIRPGKTLATPLTQVNILRTARVAEDAVEPYRTFTLEGSVPEGFVFGKDGRSLYGSSYYTGVSNIYRYDIEQGATEAMSNTDVGFFSPIVVDTNRLIVSRYTAQGFVPTLVDIAPTTDMSAISFLGQQVAEQHPEVRTWMQPSAASLPFEANVTRRGDYEPVKELGLQSIIPTIERYKQSTALGLAAEFSDPMGFATLSLNAGYSPDKELVSRERVHATADFHYGRWSVGAKWNAANFYDFFGPVKRSREGYSGYVNYERPMVYNPPLTVDFVANAAYYGGLDALPNFQNVQSPSRHLSTLSVGFRSANLRSSPGAVDFETGNSWLVMAHGYGAEGKVTPSLQLEYHAGAPLPMDHSSVWLRTAAIISSGKLDSPLSNTYLGGFRNNYVDSRIYSGAQRYRGSMLSSMPGFEIDSLSGRTLGKVMLEWCLPPLRFENSGRPGLYAYWMRPEFFVSAVQTNPDNRSRRETAKNIGFQLDFSIMTMHRLPVVLSVGAARGFGAGGKGKNEFMLSLLVL